MTTLQYAVNKSGIYNWNDPRIDVLLATTRINLPDALMRQLIDINYAGQAPRRVRLRKFSASKQKSSTIFLSDALILARHTRRYKQFIDLDKRRRAKASKRRLKIQSSIQYLKSHKLNRELQTSQAPTENLLMNILTFNAQHELPRLG